MTTEVVGEALAAAIHDAQSLNELAYALKCMQDKQPTPLEQRALLKFQQDFQAWIGRLEQEKRARRRKIDA
jgi:hypothetical protein